jgi:hypothetical protein
MDAIRKNVDKNREFFGFYNSAVSSQQSGVEGVFVSVRSTFTNTPPLFFEKAHSALEIISFGNAHCQKIIKEARLNETIVKT